MLQCIQKLISHIIYTYIQQYSVFISQDWETMVSLLSDDASCGVVLTSEGERALIDMLAYSIKKASDTTVITAKGKEKVHVQLVFVVFYFLNFAIFIG